MEWFTILGLRTPARFPRRGAFALALAALLFAFPAAAAKPKPGRDFTFVVMSDIHIGAQDLKAVPPVTSEQNLARLKSSLDRLRGLVGKPWPERPGFSSLDLGTVQTPRGLIILGDLTDGDKELARQQEQWKAFEDLFPVAGIPFGSATIPVLAVAGNHDGDPGGPQRQGLISRNRQMLLQGKVTAISPNGAHFAVNWDGVHFIGLNLCAADTTDAETPFRFGTPGPGSWNDPLGALAFLKSYLALHVGKSHQPVVIMQHYGFDGFSTGDWYWWTPKQRRTLYELLKGYNVAAIFHGHDHHADHYRWPDPKRHADDLKAYFDGKPPSYYRQYDIVSCGPVAWVMRIQGDRLISAHFLGPDWNTDRTLAFVKTLKP